MRVAIRCASLKGSRTIVIWFTQINYYSSARAAPLNCGFPAGRRWSLMRSSLANKPNAPFLLEPCSSALDP